VHYPEFGTIALVAVFGKTEKSDLTQSDQRAIAAMIKNYRTELQREFAWMQRARVDRNRGGNNGEGG
jgi:hypothetical protein